ncbi:hypothetical protein MMC28_003934 [Mycoblastus sanguinarius]|nr:hypothetical protein [Mycoblastus sanguinarius]
MAGITGEQRSTDLGILTMLCIAIIPAVYAQDNAQDATDKDQNTVLGSHGKHVRTAHGVIMAVVFLCLKPAGAILLRVLEGKLAFRVHVGWQITAWLIAVTGVGLGVWLAKTMNRFGDKHPIIGFVVVTLFVLQPSFGYIHHRVYWRVRKRTVWGVAHVWVGRTVLLLGIINGGFGLQAAENSVGGEIAYAVVAGVSFLAYVGIMTVIAYRKH